MTAKQFCENYNISFSKLKELIRNELLYPGLKENQRIPDYIMPTVVSLLKKKAKKKLVTTKSELNKKENTSNEIIVTKLKHINFLEGYVEFKKPKTNKIKVDASNRIFQSIFVQLKFLHNLDIALVSTGKVYLLKSNKLVEKIIEILIVENKFRFRNVDFPIDESFLPSWELKSFSSVFDSYKERCIETLFNISFENQIGYIPEVIIGNDEETLKTEPSLLILVRNKKKYFFIWESLLDRKATYIFSCGRKENIFQLKATLIDFIGALKLKNKRETLIKNDKLKQQLRFKDRILHNGDHEDWKITLMNILR